MYTILFLILVRNNKITSHHSVRCVLDTRYYPTPLPLQDEHQLSQNPAGERQHLHLFSDYPSFRSICTQTYTKDTTLYINDTAFEQRVNEASFFFLSFSSFYKLDKVWIVTEINQQDLAIEEQFNFWQFPRCNVNLFISASSTDQKTFYAIYYANFYLLGLFF